MWEKKYGSAYVMICLKNETNVDPITISGGDFPKKTGKTIEVSTERAANRPAPKVRPATFQKNPE